ncbi:hypothetical protein E8K88_17350 [Lampropedia aestuarii]|uniref:Uncharacterized protein n=1 Tax=Lampropedia aestuarii TaxID=2562762 RepID=A0A4S5BEP5_9BURK|nr:hypothetical protein [Lampropedia aestuarii]THJ30737.1 hypothetical protein E8K88_17350 [Lampropedia aestuarii]
MPTFRRNTGGQVTGTIDLVQGNTLRLKIDGVVKGGKADHYQIRSSSPLITVTQSPNERQREQTITLKVSETGTAQLITISAHSLNNNSVGASFRINILPKLVLPDFASEIGIVTHLLLAESITPNMVNYGDGSEALRAMELMREVLDNRLSAANSSDLLRSYVACNPTTNDMRGIVRANVCGRAPASQFEGFDGVRSSPAADQLKVINAVLAQANDGSHNLFEKARAHVERAIQIASLPSRTQAITESSLVYWRTTSTGAPSSHAKEQKVLAGQTFFSLSSNFLKNPQNPGKT